MKFRIFYLCLLAFSHSTIAVAQTESVEVIFNDIWTDEDAAAEPSKTVKLVYIDYTDDENLKSRIQRNWGRTVTFLHTTPPDDDISVANVFVKDSGKASTPVQSSFAEYMINSLTNRLALEGFRVGETDRYIGFAPIVAETAIRYSTLPHTKAYFMIIVFTGVEGEQPSYTHTFRCMRDARLDSGLREFARPLEICIENAVDQALGKKEIAAFLDAL